MIIRESRLGRAICRGVSIWAILFGIVFGWLGNHVTSKQWQLLMGVPGDKWFWAIVFTVPGSVALLGLTTTAYRAIATGLFVIGCGCLLISSFYLLAPLIDPGLFTLGWVPWLMCAAVAFFGAVTNWTDVRWF